MKLTNKVYRLIIKLFHFIPVRLRSSIFKIWKKSGLPYKKFYKDLRFEGKLEVTLKDSKFYMHSTGGTVENEIFWKGIYRSLEPESIWIFEQLIKTGITSMIDVGANTGVYSLFSYTLNPQLNIIAFEPSRKTCSKLISNIAMNRYDIKVENIALSNSIGNAVFYDVFDENQTNASLSSKMLKDNPNTNVRIDEYVVDITTFDDYYFTSGIGKIDFIKIDVELYETEVLEGMIQTIDKESPYLLFEVLTDEVAERINKIMEGFGSYQLYEFITEKGEYHIRPIEKLVGRINYNWNYFACPASKVENIKSLIH